MRGSEADCRGGKRSSGLQAASAVCAQRERIGGGVRSGLGVLDRDASVESGEPGEARLRSTVPQKRFGS